MFLNPNIFFKTANYDFGGKKINKFRYFLVDKGPSKVQKQDFTPKKLKFVQKIKFCHDPPCIEVYRVGRENLYTFEMAAILAVSTLQRRVIRGWNGNFVGFLGIFSKIVKNISMKRYLHFSGKRRIWPTRI